MGTRILFVREEYDAFVEKARTELKCRLGEKTEVTRFLKTIKMEFIKRKKEGGLEDCLIWEDDKRWVLAWTTVLSVDGKFRDSDEAWVLIIDKRKPAVPCFYSFPIHRVGDFYNTFFSWLKACVEVASNWPPPCSVCDKDVIVKLIVAMKQEDLHAVAFFCFTTKFHPLESHDFYQGMSAESKKFVMGKYQSYYDGRKRYFEEHGEYPKPKRFVRFEAKKKRQQPPDKKQSGGTRVIVGEFSDMVNIEKHKDTEGVDYIPPTS